MSDEVIKEIVNKGIAYINAYLEDEYRADFDRNLATFKVHKSRGVDDLFKNYNLNKDNTMLGLYFIHSNELLLLCDNLETIKRLYNDKNNDIAARLILHELFHMASSMSDKYSGVTTIESNNTGLNEGITEMLAFKAYPSLNLNYSGYLYELLLTMQLSMVVGFDNIYEAYFVTHNLDKIKSKLNEYLNDMDKVNDFFSTFQQSYYIGSTFQDYSLLGKLQSTLVEALSNKRTGKVFMESYKKFLITPDLLLTRNKYDKEVPYLQDSINLLNDIKNKRNK